MLLYLLLTALSAFCAVVPMVSFLALLWWLDRYDREPVWLMGLTFLWGACGAVTLALIGNTSVIALLQFTLGSDTAGIVGPVAVAPLIEEPVKWIVLLAVARSRHFDNTTDGFVYGAASGLGFGMTENFLYFSAVGASGDLLSWALTVLIRTFFSAAMHATATACSGSMVGLARFRGVPGHMLFLPLGLAVAMSIHAAWNGLLTADQQAGLGGALMAMDLVAFPAEFAVVFIAFQLCLWEERTTIRRELEEEAKAGILPAAHVPVLASWLRRGTGAWHPSKVTRGAYVRAATTLAFRKSQARRARGPSAQFYKDDVERLRREVAGMLATEK